MPKGPLVLTFADDQVEATLDGKKMSGSYYGEPVLNFLLRGSGDVTEKTGYFLELTADVSPAPQTATDPVTLRATFEFSMYSPESTGTGPACTYERRYTATR